MAQLQDLTVDDIGSLDLPAGTQANRPTINSTVNSFTTVGTTSWTAPAGVTSIEVLVVAGGGGGGRGDGGGGMGGGGGGGVIYNSNYTVIPGTAYTVTVGGGGSGGIGTTSPGNGGNSVFDALVAVGGGAGASNLTNAQTPGSNGGSGGGGSGFDRQPGGIGGYPTIGQGHPGGTGGNTTNAILGAAGYKGGGGGGAGGPGWSYWAPEIPLNSGRGLDGGPGFLSSVSGTPTYYGGGGGGGCIWSAWAVAMIGGRGGIGGGGNGGGHTTTPGSGENGQNGTNGLGGGGGGAAYQAALGGNGGSGCVIIRFSTPATNTRATGQTRFNTQTNTTETFNTFNRWAVQDQGDPIVTNGLVLNLDASRYGSGTTVNDLSGNGNTGTLLNGTSFSSANEGLFVFDGTDDRISIANSASLRPTSELTIELWLRASVVQTAGWTKLIGHETYTNGYLVFLESSATQEIRALVMTSSGEIRCNTPIRIFAGNWIHVVFTFKMGDAIRSYFNAVPSTVANLPTGTFSYASTSDPIQIGGTQSPNHFNGTMGSIKIYNRALSSAEVEQNYNAQAVRFDLGPKNTLGSTPRLAASSAEALRAAGITTDGPYWIRPAPGLTPYLTYCRFGYIDGGDWMLLLKVHNRADMDADSANWSNATLINENDMNLISGSMSKYGIWNTFRFTRLMMQMADRIPPIMIFNTPRTMYEAINVTTPRANNVGVPCQQTDPQISTTANTRYDSMPMKQGAPFPSQTGNEPFVQQWGINVFTSGGPGGAYIGCPLDEGGHVFNAASNAGGDSGFGFGGSAGNTTRRWSCGYGEWATSAIADTLPGYVWVR